MQDYYYSLFKSILKALNYDASWCSIQATFLFPVPCSLTIMTDQVNIESNLKQFLLVLSVSLSVATLSQTVKWFREIPYTLLLVIVGLILTSFHVQLVNLSPELIVLVFLPSLLFEAGWNLKWSDLRRDLIPICLYAVVGVLISVLGVALALNKFGGIPLAIALLVGASISATDPVSVIALFREIGVKQRLAMLVEGESLFNDGTAAVAFNSLVGLSTGTGDVGILSLLIRSLTFIGIGIGIGSLIGFGISYLTKRFDSPLIEQSLTLVSAYGSYVITEISGGSGVIGVVVTGLILGNFGSQTGMLPSTRLTVTQFWEFIAFFVNSILFLLIGNQISLNTLTNNLGLITLVVGAMLLTRAIGIYGLGYLSNWLFGAKISLSEQTVVWWGGIRGAVSIALALSLPSHLPHRDAIVATVFGVVLFTLLVQGLTIKPMLAKLGLLDKT